jgi:predicted RNA binding protein YcfA (HicA-like mRNA interferase family)
MPSLSELPSINRKKLIKALQRLGFYIVTVGGKGSHVKIVYRNQKSITLPQDMRKDVLYYVLKEIEKETGVTWEDIKEVL